MCAPHIFSPGIHPNYRHLLWLGIFGRFANRLRHGDKERFSMFPVLFNIGNISIETYYVVWFVALYLALRWTFRRMTLYEIDGNEGRRIIAWGIAGMMLGAHAIGYAWNFPVYWTRCGAEAAI